MWGPHVVWLLAPTSRALVGAPRTRAVGTWLGEAVYGPCKELHHGHRHPTRRHPAPIPTAPWALWWDDPQFRTMTEPCWGGGCGEEDRSGQTTATRCVCAAASWTLHPTAGHRALGCGQAVILASSAGRSPVPVFSVFLALLRAPKPHVISLSALNALRDSCFLHSPMTGTLGFCHSGILRPWGAWHLWAEGWSTKVGHYLFWGSRAGRPA